MNEKVLADLRDTTVLLVHGWWGGPWVWDRFESFFTQQGIACECIDLNHSPPGSHLDPASFDTQLSRLRTAIEQLGTPILIGHSGGGLLIQKIVESTDLPAAVLVAPAAPRGIFPIRSWSMLWVAVRYWPGILFGRPFLPSQHDMNTINLNALSTDEQISVYEKMIPVSRRQALQVAARGISVDASQVKTPMFVINGTRDRLTPPAVAKAIAHKYGATYREYPENAHYLMREPNWESIAADIHAWLLQQKLVSRAVS